MELIGPEPQKAKDDPHAVGRLLSVQEHQAVLLERPRAQSCIHESTIISIDRNVCFRRSRTYIGSTVNPR